MSFVKKKKWKNEKMNFRKKWGKNNYEKKLLGKIIFFFFFGKLSFPVKFVFELLQVETVENERLFFKKPILVTIILQLAQFFVMCTSGHSFNWQANDFSLVAKTFPFMISRASGKNPLLFFFDQFFPHCWLTLCKHTRVYMNGTRSSLWIWMSTKIRNSKRFFRSSYKNDRVILKAHANFPSNCTVNKKIWKSNRKIKIFTNFP